MSDDHEIYPTISLEKKGYKIFSKPTALHHQVCMSDKVLDDSFEYAELIMFLDDVQPMDQVTFHLGNFGGSCHSGVRLIHAVQTCSAFVTMKVTGNCYSMGAILALSGDMLQMCHSTELMFHNYSTVESGKAGEMKLAVNEFDEHFNRFLDQVCAPFLTPKELKRIQDDGDVYIHEWDRDLIKRVERHFPMYGKLKVDSEND